MRAPRSCALPAHARSPLMRAPRSCALPARARSLAALYCCNLYHVRYTTNFMWGGERFYNEDVVYTLANEWDCE
jgi:hypothetical protein